MPAYKRSSPRKQAAEREKIVRDLEEREAVPQSERMYPNLIERGRRVIQGALERRRLRREPPPREEGAKVIGRKRTSNIA